MKHEAISILFTNKNSGYLQLPETLPRRLNKYRFMLIRLMDTLPLRQQLVSQRRLCMMKRQDSYEGKCMKKYIYNGNWKPIVLNEIMREKSNFCYSHSEYQPWNLSRLLLHRVVVITVIHIHRNNAMSGWNNCGIKDKSQEWWHRYPPHPTLYHPTPTYAHIYNSISIHLFLPLAKSFSFPSIFLCACLPSLGLNMIP